MTKIEKSVIINARVDEVFKYISDWERWEEWFEGVSDFKPTTETSKGNGTRYAYKVKMMGLKVPVETEVYDFEENKGWNGVSTKGVPHKTHYILEPIDNKTKFTCGMEYNLPIPFIGSLLDNLFLKHQWMRILEHSLTKVNEKFS